ncbi:EscT/YscT/HrcT family type III secretion system export apparatus protein [Neochlamydia sp. TUME1]|uniref:EscT/YscT/HrcT family type III secretion system export apparatus protein n=1 Tax=Neochlamydia sp. TUME1 TaxID=1478174 RepID=UPI000691F35D|nr:flagellar biosynthetic protein FliR [Neochlamydia sp. TUME1]
MSETTDSFIALFLNSAFNTEGGLLSFVALFFLFLSRFFPILLQSPFFGARVMPQPAKVALGIGLFIIFLPQLLLVTHKIDFNLKLVFLIFKELFVGTIIGFLISLPFVIVQSAGIIIDHQRGGASLMVNDPTIQNQSSPLGTLFNYVMIWIFFMIDGPFLFMDAILTSYEVIPADQIINPKFFERSSVFWANEIALLNKIMVISIRLASPALIMIMMTDFFLGIANRLAPQVQITFLGMPLKSLLALLIVCVGWKMLNEEMAKQGYVWINEVINMLRTIKGSVSGFNEVGAVVS